MKYPYHSFFIALYNNIYKHIGNHYITHYITLYKAHKLKKYYNQIMKLHSFYIVL